MNLSEALSAQVFRKMAQDGHSRVSICAYLGFEDMGTVDLRAETPYKTMDELPIVTTEEQWFNE